MARAHGKDVKLYYAEIDATSYAGSIAVKPTAAVHDVTQFSSGAVEYAAGLIGWEGTIESVYDNAAAGLWYLSAGRLGSDTASHGLFSWFDNGAAAIGDKGFVGSPAVIAENSTPLSVNDMVRSTLTIRGNGRPGIRAVLLHPLATRSSTNNVSSHDAGAAESNGGRGNLHVTAVTGDWTIAIQDSADNSSFATIISFANVTAVGGYTGTVTGSVRRYRRVLYTVNSAGSITFVVGFSAY